MSYISAITKGENVIVWERGENGREVKTYKTPNYFYVEDHAGEFIGMDGVALKKLEFRTRAEFRKARDSYKSRGHPLYESDIPPHLKILSEHYYEKPAPKLNVSFLDIEVDYDTSIGFSSVDNPYAPINAIAFFHMWKKEYVVYVVIPQDGTWIEEHGADFDQNSFIEKLHDISPIEESLEVVFFKTEKELLRHIISEIEDSDVLVGWNSSMFDMPYIAKRVEMVLGASYFRRLSLPGADLPKYKDVHMYGNVNTSIDLSGRDSVDFLLLFQKFEMTKRPSYKLESIADDVVPDLPKLSYTGTLAELYKSDLVTFIRYNIRDTEILYGFEKKLGYVELANQMYHSSTGLMSHILGTLKLAELSIVNHCHYITGVRVADNKTEDESESIKGAYVLDPKRGMHEFIGSVDINSLYPSVIISLNISPETIIGQFKLGEDASELIIKHDNVTNICLVYEDGTYEEHTGKQWRGIFKKRKWAVSGYGTVFDQSKKGIVPAVLEQWISIRKKYKKMAYGALQTKDMENYFFYDRLQYVFKIKLNSLYGALCNRFFRFYDLRMGSSTTAVSRLVLNHQCAKVNESLTGEYVKDGAAVIYGDTDSTYFNTWGRDKKEAVVVADAVCAAVNESFKKFMQDSFICHPGFDDVIKSAREMVASTGIFVDKKRYILRVVDDEGEAVDKLKVVGLETKKTTLPKHVSDELNAFVKRLLLGDEWDSIATDIVKYKNTLSASNNRMLIGLPKGVNNVEKYTKEYLNDPTTRLPGHVAASILYNECLAEYDDVVSLKIMSGMKIKVFYLNKPIGRFKAIAIPTDIESIPSWFIDNFEIDMEAHITRLIDKPLGNIIGAIGKEIPTAQSLLNDSLLGF